MAPSHNNAPSESDMAEETRVPFKDFLSYASFVSSVGIALCVSAAQTLACTTSFFGLSDAATMAQVRYSAEIFTWGAAVYGLSLILSLLNQLLLTSPGTVAMIHEGPDVVLWVRLTVATAAWISLGLVGGATALVGEGLKLIHRGAGATLEWVLLAFGSPMLVLWIYLRTRMLLDNHKR